MSYIIKVKNTSGTEGTVIADVGFSYQDNLNEINEGQLKISGSSVSKRGLFEIGSEVYIYRNGTLEFHGLINGISFLDAGGIAADLVGYEIWLGKENGNYSSSPYSSTASATIASNIIGESNYFTAGTIETGSDIDFRIEKTDSIFNALKRLIKRVGQDIGIDYANSEVDILDHKGSSTSVATLNDGMQIRDVVARQSYPVANDVRVYGKSEGTTRIVSDYASHGQDATSKATYGVIRKIVNEPSVTTQDEADKLADNLVAKYKNPVKVYEFDVINPNLSIESGDVLNLNSQTKGLSNESVRVVGLRRGVSGNNEFLTIEVTNEEYSEKTKNINQKLAELENNQRLKDTYDQHQEEYTNRNCSTCIGGNSYVCSDNCWSFAGKLYYNGVITCLSDIFGACYDNQYLSFDSGITVCASQFQSGSHGGVSSCWNIFSNGIDMCNACIINVGTICADCFCGGGVGDSLWEDDTNPYITPKGGCGIKICEDIMDGTSLNKLGIDSSPGAFKEVNAYCGKFVTCVGAPTIYASGGVSICNSSGKVADFGTTCTCLPTIRTKNIHAYTSGGCSVGITSCRFGSGYINCIYSCRKLIIPVGTNCY
jgi:hypothetical protein